MKFWQKTFLILLLIFMICLNCGILCIAHISYSSQLKNESEKAVEGQYFVSGSIKKDFQSLEERELFSEDSIRSVFNNYSKYYKKSSVYLILIKEKQILYSSTSEELRVKIENEIKYKDAGIKIYNQKGNKGILVMGSLGSPYEEYSLIYIHALTEMQREWRVLGAFFGVASFCIGLVLTLALIYTLKNLTKPLETLAEAADIIAQGNYQERVKVSGNDEVATLAANFNNMASSIDEKIMSLKESDEQKQLFINNLAHELRTPLTTISGYAELIKLTQMNEENRLMALDYIITETKRLEKMSRILLDLIQLRKDEIEMCENSTEELAEKLRLTFSLKFKQKSISFLEKIEIDKIYGNGPLLESLLYNIVENSLRACTKSGKIILIIKKMEDNKTCICVSDNGIGMEEKELDKITEPFYRIDKARSRNSGGIGLGLSLVKQIVECHKGNMFYKSKLGEGTTITIIY
ncbi:sensor histidine kinase [Anaeromicropila populeti]|uniref:histidine kinase n=1 Tax=Anaeromicropila populeti TaxID=37658 RepID=A0A1I6IA00_9FIRM|nr:HAMP domain-containing sensor histidine kinase [Anaeromicropila populeti]SFR63582.1 Signal transduction histidine kinase [Anaeromicropila populeti]